MTLLYPDRVGTRTGPAVHALIIGVGSYRHLTAQLTSPPVSALAFADWVMHTMRHPQAPLGSVDVLLSPGRGTPPGGEPMSFDVPDLDAMYDAVAAWRQRCDAHPGNVALFYFCGHGLNVGGHALLLEDYGKSPSARLRGAFLLEEFVAAMASCEAGSQYFFIDACQTPAPSLVARGARASSLLDPGRAPRKNLDGGVLVASRRGGAAGGAQGQVSVWTRSLLDGLNGLAAEPRDGQWHVEVNRLNQLLPQLCARRSVAAPGPPQVPGGGPGMSGVLHLMQEPPRVPMEVRCDPAEATAHAKVGLRAHNPPHDSPRLALLDAVWHTEAPAGPYAVEVAFSGDEYPGAAVSTTRVFHPMDLTHTVSVRGER
ncbi:caspase family protein [Streptomyces sp. NPDC004561]